MAFESFDLTRVTEVVHVTVKWSVAFLDRGGKLDIAADHLFGYLP